MKKYFHQIGNMIKYRDKNAMFLEEKTLLHNQRLRSITYYDQQKKEKKKSITYCEGQPICHLHSTSQVPWESLSKIVMIIISLIYR